MSNAPTKKVALRLRLSPIAESIVRQGHPWVFTDSIRSQTRPAKAGELALIFDRNDTFMALGLYDPDSPIRVRILHVGKPVQINAAWWETHLEKALALRKNYFDPNTTGRRLINGEGDQWPGLVLDQYDDTLVLKIYTSGWFPHLEKLIPLFAEKLKPKTIILRLSRNTQEKALKNYQLKDGSVLYGKSLDQPVLFKESELFFYADVIKGQKTGFFLDQRENRRKVEKLAQGRTVLNLFSFSGGFSLYAARGGAAHVTSVDISAHALAELNKNWDINSCLTSSSHEEVQADVFLWLEKPSKKYDLIIIDPPSLAKKEKDREAAIFAYEKLTLQSLKLLNPGGVLVSCSCSAHVTTAEFTQAVREAVTRTNRNFQELEVTSHAQDHPSKIPEMNYLKAVFLKEIT